MNRDWLSLEFEAPKNGMSLLFKAKTSPIKDSVAATIRAKETLASIAVHSLESEKKRKASGDHQIHQTKKRRKSPERTQSQDKANRQKTPKPEQNLPRRNLLNFEKPEPEQTKKPEPEKTKKPEPEKKKPSKQPDFKLTPEAMKAIAARKGQIPNSSKAIPNLQSNSERPFKPQKEPEKQPEKPKKPEKPEKSEKKIQVNYKTKPFGQLMSDVVFTISGYQNPFRGELRQKAHDMGARYRGDWDNSCTHLICAFVNTPKFNQVKGRGKI